MSKASPAAIRFSITSSHRRRHIGWSRSTRCASSLPMTASIATDWSTRRHLRHWATSSAGGYVIEVRPSILRESDGPMLVVGLQQIHGQQIHLPRRTLDLPDRARLERRYEQFRQAAG